MFLVLILNLNINPISKSIKNYFDLISLGIVAHMKTLSLGAFTPLTTVYSTNPRCCRRTAPQKEEPVNPALSTSSLVGSQDDVVRRTTAFGVDTGRSKWMKKHFSKATITCPQKQCKTVTEKMNKPNINLIPLCISRTWFHTCAVFLVNHPPAFSGSV